MACENKHCVETDIPFKRVVSEYTDLNEFVGLLLDVIDCTLYVVEIILIFMSLPLGVASLEEIGLAHQDISLGNLVFEHDAESAGSEECTGRLTDMDFIAPLQEVEPSGDASDLAYDETHTDESATNEDVCIVACQGLLVTDSF